jgi:hypothetical protein
MASAGTPLAILLDLLEVPMFRALIVSATLLLGMSPPRLADVRTLWKEEGWISTCAGVGCLGRRFDCFIYSTRDQQGRHKMYYCYMG